MHACFERKLASTLMCCLLLSGILCGLPNLAEPKNVDMTFLRAALNGNLTEVKAMLEKGADPNIKNKAGKSALDYAAKEGLDEIREMMKRYSESDRGTRAAERRCMPSKSKYRETKQQSHRRTDTTPEDVKRKSSPGRTE